MLVEYFFLVTGGNSVTGSLKLRVIFLLFPYHNLNLQSMAIAFHREILDSLKTKTPSSLLIIPSIKFRTYIHKSDKILL